MEASKSKKEEDTVIEKLLRENAKLWGPLRAEPVSDQTEEMCCGWKQVRPSAEYDLTKTRRRKKTFPVGAVASTLSLAPEESLTSAQYPYMSGELDENYSYVYKGGLSPRASKEFTLTSSTEGSLDQNSRSPAPLAQCHRRMVVLEPEMLPPLHHRGQYQVEALAKSRAELAKILALQLKPELLVEQLIIENRLRTMSLATFPVLEGIGASGKKSDRTYSQSTPALGTLPNTHVDYQKRPRHHPRGSPHKPPKTHLQWCGLSGGQTASAVPPNPQSGLQYHERSGTHNVQSSSKQTLHGDTAGVPTDSSQYNLPKVSPNLVTETASKGNRKHKRLNPLLYNPEGSGHRSTGGSTLYYPHVSYSNSRHVKFK